MTQSRFLFYNLSFIINAGFVFVIFVYGIQINESNVNCTRFCVERLLDVYMLN